MPFCIRVTSRDEARPYCVYTEGPDGRPRGEPHGCHATEAEAKAQLRALYANVPDARKAGEADELRFAFGGAIKATGPTTIEGLLIPYGGPEELDADGEYFDARTDLGVRLPAAFKLFYHHGMNAKVGRVPLAWAELERRADGVYFTSDLAEELDEWEAEERAKAMKYRAVVLRMARDGELGASSGAAAHVVVRQAAGKGGRIARWPLAEASVTPTPSNHRTAGTVTLKALLEMPDPLDLAEPDECGECKARSLAADTDELTAAAKALTAAYARLAAKEGRAMSTSRRSRLQALVDSLLALLAETEPRPRDAGAPTATETAAAETPAPAQAGDGAADSAPVVMPLSPSAWPSAAEVAWLGA